MVNLACCHWSWWVVSLRSSYLIWKLSQSSTKHSSLRLDIYLSFGINLLEYPIPAATPTTPCHKNCHRQSLCNQAWYHSSASVKTTRKKIYIGKFEKSKNCKNGLKQSKMVKIDQNGQNGLKRSKMIKKMWGNGQKW